MYVSICFEFDNNNKIFLSLTNFAYVKKKKKKEVMSSTTSNVYMNWLKFNMKFNQSSVLMQNNDNFKQLLFCKKPSSIQHWSVVT